ncbi:MAG: hypothetical protein ACYTHN_25015 [Planctomycetota bacterium]
MRRKRSDAGTAFPWLPGFVILVTILAGCRGHFPEAYRNAPVGFRQYPGEFLDPGEIRNQSSDLPELVTVLLSPTLGCPARMEPTGTLEILTDREPGSRWRYFLVPRSALPFLEETEFVMPTPGPEEARSIIRKRDRFSERISRFSRKPADPAAVADESREAALHRLRAAESGIESLEDIRLPARLPGIAELPESQRTLKRAIGRLRRRIRDAIRRQAAGIELTVESVTPVSQLIAGQDHAGSWGEKVHRVVLKPGAGGRIEEGLYALAVTSRRKKKLIDVQINAVYAKKDGDGPFHFVVAADPQWGMNEEVAKYILGFVQAVNMRWAAGGPEKPEFVMILGDIVDCNFAARGSDISIFNYTYTKEYLQTWLVLAGWGERRKTGCTATGAPSDPCTSLSIGEATASSA